MIFVRLFQALFVSYLKQERLRFFFTIVSIILGVSLYVSTRITTDNILVSFDASTKYISDSDTIRITSDTGSISEDIIPKLLAIPEINALTPFSSQYVEAYADDKNLGYVSIIGVDILSINQLLKIDKQAALPSYYSFFLDFPIQAFVSSKLAEANGKAQMHLLVNGESKPILINSVISGTNKAANIDDYVMVVDIKNYQNLFNKYHDIDQLIVTLNTTDVKAAISNIAQILPKPLRISQGNENSNFSKEFTRLFQFNFNFILCLALLVTAIIIYNAVSYYILERRRDFGIMLMLGVQPRDLFISSLLTSLLITTTCAAIGVLVGYLISLLSIQHIAHTVSTVYLPVRVTEVVLPLKLIVEVFVLIWCMTLLVAFLPCLEIYRIPLRETTAYQTYETQFQTKIMKITTVGIGLFFISCVGIIPKLLEFNIIYAYVALLGILMSIAFFLPSTLLLFLKGIRRIMSISWVEAIIAVDHIMATMRKNVVAIAAMSIAISMYLILIIITDSAHYTATNWINYIFSADVYISEKNSSFNFIDSYLPEELVEFLDKNTSIRANAFLVHKDILFQDLPLRIIATKFNNVGKAFKVQFIKPMTPTEINNISADIRNVFVSEAVANKLHLKIGDFIDIPGNHGAFKVRIANMYYEYTAYQNILLMPSELFTQLYDEARVENAMVYLQDPALYQTLINDIKHQFPKLNLLILHQTEIKNIAATMMENTFTIGNMIVYIILFLTALTLFNTLEQLIISRRLEFSIFWSIGANDYTLIKMCLWESFIICCTAVLNAIIPTTIIIALLFNYLNKAVSGIDIFLTVSYASIISFFLLLFVIVLLDGLIPALKVRKLINAEALRYE